MLQAQVVKKIFFPMIKSVNRNLSQKFIKIIAHSRSKINVNLKLKNYVGNNLYGIVYTVEFY